MKLFTDKDALDLNKEGYGFFAWDESVKDDRDIEIEVKENDFEQMAASFGEASYKVYPGAKIKVIENRNI